jgi:hypothetical protein
MVFSSEYHCEQCGRKYTNVKNRWCKQCLLHSLEDNTSGNETIDYLIREMQLKVDSYEDIIFEWIPYNQFNNIIETGKQDFYELYSAIWNDGPLNYVDNKYFRKRDERVTVRCFNNSQNITNEFLNEV